MSSGDSSIEITVPTSQLLQLEDVYKETKIFVKFEKTEGPSCFNSIRNYSETIVTQKFSIPEIQISNAKNGQEYKVLSKEKNTRGEQSFLAFKFFNSDIQILGHRIIRLEKDQERTDFPNKASESGSETSDVETISSMGEDTEYEELGPSAVLVTTSSVEVERTEYFCEHQSAGYCYNVPEIISYTPVNAQSVDIIIKQEMSKC